MADTNRLDKLSRGAGSVLGKELDSLHVVDLRRTLYNLLSPGQCFLILYCTEEYVRAEITAKCSTKHHRRFFLPVVIKLYNASPFCKRGVCRRLKLGNQICKLYPLYPNSVLCCLIFSVVV